MLMHVTQQTVSSNENSIYNIYGMLKNVRFQQYMECWKIYVFQTLQPRRNFREVTPREIRIF